MIHFDSSETIYFLYLSNCTLRNNTANLNGGCILTKGYLYVFNSKFYNNSAGSSGSTIYIYNKAEILIENSVDYPFKIESIFAAVGTILIATNFKIIG